MIVAPPFVIAEIDAKSSISVTVSSVGTYTRVTGVEPASTMRRPSASSRLCSAAMIADSAS